MKTSSGTRILVAAACVLPAWGNAAAQDFPSRPLRLLVPFAPGGNTDSTGELAVNASLFRKLPYDVERDFAPISLGTVSPLLLVKHPSLAARTETDKYRKIIQVAGVELQ